jgi:hypothetical protein
MLKQLTSQDNIITHVGEGSHIALTYGGDSVIVMQNTNVTSQAETL